MSKKASIALGIIIVLQLAGRFIAGTNANIILFVLTLIVGTFFIVELIKTNKAAGRTDGVRAIYILVGVFIVAMIILLTAAIIAGNRNKSNNNLGQETAIVSPTVNNQSNTKEQLYQQVLHDEGGGSYVLSIAAEANSYFSKNNTYKGYVLTETSSFKLPSGVFTKINISPDGKNFVVYRPVEKDQTISLCMENGMNDVVITDTVSIEKTYHCK